MVFMKESFDNVDFEKKTSRLQKFMKEFFEYIDFEKNQQTTKKHEKFPKGQRVT